MNAQDWKTYRAAVESAGGKYLDHSHFTIPTRLASKLVKAGGWKLPDHGREICVEAFGCLAWLRRPESPSEGSGFVLWGAEPMKTPATRKP